MKSLRERLDDLLMPVTESGCFLFLGTHDNPDGYGKMTINGKAEKAHRVAWKLHHGDIPDGMEVMHLCNVRSCCNVNHLRLGSHAENMAQVRKQKRGRSGAQKLTLQQVKEIRLSNDKIKLLAQKYGVSEATISRTKNGIHFAV